MKKKFWYMVVIGHHSGNGRSVEVCENTIKIWNGGTLPTGPRKVYRSVSEIWAVKVPGREEVTAKAVDEVSDVEEVLE